MRDRPVDFSSSDVVAECMWCQRRITLTDGQFGSHEPAIDCRTCGLPVSYYERILAVTDASDPILNADAVATVSWFHVSTREKWPPAIASGRDRALHLGTYEAAIDTMYYRKARHGEAARSFFLHRVAVDHDAVVDPVIHADGGPPGYGIMHPSVVTDGGYTVRQYINATEHRGSLSLAVVLEAIDGVQTIAIPIPPHRLAADAHAVAADAEHAAAVAAATQEHDAAMQAFLAEGSPIESEDPLQQSMLDMTKRSRRAAIPFARDRQIHSADTVLDASPRDRYLAGHVSAERREAVGDALASRVRDIGGSLHDLYQDHAPLLTDPNAVIAKLNTQPVYRSTVLRGLR